MSANQLPAGYVVLSNVAVHISQLRKYTTDVRRFQRYLPLIDELMLHEPGTDPWRKVTVGLSLAERREFETTMYESAALKRACIEDLSEENPEGLDDYHGV